MEDPNLNILFGLDPFELGECTVELGLGMLGLGMLGLGMWLGLGVCCIGIGVWLGIRLGLGIFWLGLGMGWLRTRLGLGMVGLEYVMLVQLRFVLFVRVLGMFVFEGWKDTAKTVFNTVLYSGSQGQILLTVTPTIIIIQFIFMI